MSKIETVYYNTKDNVDRELKIYLKIQKDIDNKIIARIKY